MSRCWTLLLGLLALGASVGARAQEPEAPATESPPAAEAEDPAATSGDPSEEIIVFGDAMVRKRRQELNEDLLEQGYRPGKDKGKYTLYRPDSPWHPSVAVYEEGFVVLKRTPVRFEPPIAGHSNLRYLACVPPLTLLCVRPGGQLVSPRKLGAAKGRLALAIDPELHAWQEALAAASMRLRVEQEVPAMLEAIWLRGDLLSPGAPPLDTPESRRAAILDFWASRADTQEGDQVREVIELFLRYEVMGSAWPVTPEEAAAAEQRCSCGRALVLEAPPATPDGAP